MTPFSTHFYHSQLRTYSKIFNAIFSNVRILQDNVYVKVPITHGPKDKSTLRNADDDLMRQPATVLPRMSFDITDIEYDTYRKTTFAPNGFCVTVDGQDLRVARPSPWNLTYVLQIHTKKLDETYQIIEQIMSYFNDTLNAQIVLLNNTNIKFDVPLNIQGIDLSDTYEGDVSDIRAIITKITFKMHVLIFGGFNTPNLINNINIEMPDQNTILSISASVNGVPINHPPADGIYDTVVSINES